MRTAYAHSKIIFGPIKPNHMCIKQTNRTEWNGTESSTQRVLSQKKTTEQRQQTHIVYYSILHKV